MSKKIIHPAEGKGTTAEEAVQNLFLVCDSFYGHTGYKFDAETLKIERFSSYCGVYYQATLVTRGAIKAMET